MKIMWTILLVALMSGMTSQSNAEPELRSNKTKILREVKPTDNYNPKNGDKTKILREVKPTDNYKPKNDKK